MLPITPVVTQIQRCQGRENPSNGMTAAQGIKPSHRGEKSKSVPQCHESPVSLMINQTDKVIPQPTMTNAAATHLSNAPQLSSGEGLLGRRLSSGEVECMPQNFSGGGSVLSRAPTSRMERQTLPPQDI